LTLLAALVALVAAAFGSWIGAYLQGRVGRRRERIAFLFEIRVKLFEIDRAEMVTGNRAEVDELMPWLCVAATDSRLRIEIGYLVYEYNDCLLRARLATDPSELQAAMLERRTKISDLLCQRISDLEKNFWARL